SAELRQALRAALPGAASLDALLEAAARAHATTAAVLRRAMEQLGLSPEFEKLVPRGTARSVP
ncbi:MAG TPA: hypothetical protein VND93_04685, partial [Myxococcales bacterium]|nr:hypothetical protein [Myxococcales bacterium]